MQYDNTKLEELKKKYTELQDKKLQLTKDINKEIRDINNAIYQEGEKKRQWEKQQKAKKKYNGYMNLIFRWDNGMEFDTRHKHALNEFKDYVFSYGLPTTFEVRG